MSLVFPTGHPMTFKRIPVLGPRHLALPTDIYLPPLPPRYLSLSFASRTQKSLIIYTTVTYICSVYNSMFSSLAHSAPSTSKIGSYFDLVKPISIPNTTSFHHHRQDLDETLIDQGRPHPSFRVPTFSFFSVPNSTATAPTLTHHPKWLLTQKALGINTTTFRTT